MPLHLLGKKSWNVYNADNIARVKRDEAAAKAAEEAEEQRMQEVDAERRLAILRGEEPPPLPPPAENDLVRPSFQGLRAGTDKERRKRKRAREDDTDFELRVAMERSSQVQASNQELARGKTSDAPIVGRDGHIDLFGAADKATHSRRSIENEAEKCKAKKDPENQHNMRLSNAAGKHGTQNPWYSKDVYRSEDLDRAEFVGKDAFGREDPGRKKRDADRITASDPLAMMKIGAARAREVKQERRKFQEERDAELRQMRREERRQEKPDRERRRTRSNEHRSRRHRDDRHDRREHSSSRRQVDDKSARSDYTGSEHFERLPQSQRRHDGGSGFSSRPTR